MHEPAPGLLTWGHRASALCTLLLMACTSTVTRDTHTFAPVCGNHAIESPEACDDGNAITEICAPGAGACQVCDASCQLVAGDCAPGYFGEGCSACACDNSGQCDDGLLGTGACACVLGWSGSTCQTACPFDWSPVPATPIASFSFGVGLTDVVWNDPTVLVVGGVYHMWLTAGDVNDSPPIVRIYHATSADTENWDVDLIPTLEPSAPTAWDDHAIETPSVIIDGQGVYHLYYTGIADGAAPGVFAIGHATSPDGTVWTRDPNNPVIDIARAPEASDWGVYSVGEPAAVYHPGEDRIYLYHIGFGASVEHEGDIAIMLATSDDGSHFVHTRDAQGNREPVWSLSASHTPASRYRGYSTPAVVLGPDGNFHLTHDVVENRAGFDQVGVAYARSADGIHFVEVDHDIAHWRTESWTTGQLLGPTLLIEDDRLLLWFAATGTLEPPNWWADFESGLARLVGTPACGRPTVVLTRSAGPGLLPGTGASVTAVRSDPDGDSTTLDWHVTSGTASGVDCGAELAVATGSGDTLTFTVPLAYSDVRCADEIVVSATVSDGSQSHTDAVAFSVEALPSLGIVWVEDAGNSVIDLPTCPDWDCIEHTDPTLGRAANGDLVLWYSAGGDHHAAGPVIGRAVSHDGGAFIKTPNAPVMEPDNAGVPPSPLPWDYFRETVSVKWNATLSAWNMLYLGYETDYFTDPAIGLTLSSDADGTSFPRSPAPIYTPTRPGGWDESFLSAPTAVLGSDGIWRIYFVGASFALGGGMKVGVLTSADDGASWQVGPPGGTNPIFAGAPGQWDESIVDCFVHFVSGRYLMWYTSFREPFAMSNPFSMGLATSEDGYVWQRHADNPILVPGTSGAWNDLRVLDGEVFLESDGSLTMAAYGASSVPPNASFPDFKPNRIGLWRSTVP